MANLAHANLGYEIAPLIAELPEGWKDISWGNDGCASAALDDNAYVRLWFDYADPAMSELDYARADGSAKQFALCDSEGATWFQTDTWAEMVEWINANSPRIAAYNAQKTAE